MLIGLSKVLFFSHKFKALSIALAGMLAVIAILYPREISSKKLSAAAQVRSDFNWLNRELNQQIAQLKDFLLRTTI